MTQKKQEKGRRPKLFHITEKLSNGHSPANLSNSSTRRKFASLANASTRQNGHFGEFGPDSIHSQKANLDEFSEFSEFSEFGEFSECRLDRFIHKNIFFCI